MSAIATIESPKSRVQSPKSGDDLARRLSGEAVVRRDEPLARRTTLRVGGAANYYVEPASEDDLKAVLEFCHEKELSWLVIGRGSNLLVRDGGFRGVVICLAHRAFSRIEVAGQKLHCGAGARMRAVAVEAKRHELAGLEFLEGIPGSIGGGLRMNAGAMGGAMFDAVESVRVMDAGGKVQDITRLDVEVQYRSCPLLKTQVALGATLRGEPGLREMIEHRMNEFSQKRWATQPAAPSAGCIFKNAPTIPAGKLVEELGLKGTRVGGVMVSNEHGNFIVNDSRGTAKDILELIEVIQKAARDKRGIELETEVEIVGEVSSQ